MATARKSGFSAAGENGLLETLLHRHLAADSISNSIPRAKSVQSGQSVLFALACALEHLLIAGWQR